jgi:hypothetical protein
MGAYTACLDVALGVSGPLLGLIATGAGLNTVFLASAFVVLCSVGVSIKLQPVRSAGVHRGDRALLRGTPPRAPAARDGVTRFGCCRNMFVRKSTHR